MGAHRLLPKELVRRHTMPGGLLSKKAQSPPHENGDPIKLLHGGQTERWILMAFVPNAVETAEPEGRGPGHG